VTGCALIISYFTEAFPVKGKGVREVFLTIKIFNQMNITGNSSEVEVQHYTTGYSKHSFLFSQAEV